MPRQLMRMKEWMESVAAMAWAMSTLISLSFHSRFGNLEASRHSFPFPPHVRPAPGFVSFLLFLFLPLPFITRLVLFFPFLLFLVRLFFVVFGPFLPCLVRLLLLLLRMQLPVIA